MADLSKVAVPPTALVRIREPIKPVVDHRSALISQTNPNGVLHIDTTGATAGETGTITVTATDSTEVARPTETFTVTAGAYNGPTDLSRRR